MSMGLKGLGVALVCCLVQARAAYAIVVVPWQITLTDRLQAQAQAQPPAFPVRLRAQVQPPAAQPADIAYVTDYGDTLGYFDPDPVIISVGDTVVWLDDGQGPDYNGSYLITSANDSWTPFDTASDPFSPAAVTFDFPGTYDYYDDVGTLGEVLVNSIPEPSTLLLAALSVLGLGVFLKRGHARSDDRLAG